MSASAVAKKYGGRQSTFSRHLRNHLKPHVHAIAQATGPMFLPPTPQAQAAQLIPTVGALLTDLGDTVQRSRYWPTMPRRTAASASALFPCASCVQA